MQNNYYKLIEKEPQLICLSEKVGGHRIFMYRDDPEDFEFGGNKVRFYEYLIPEIKEYQPDVIVTTGSIYSNHIRVTAKIASMLGIQCVLLLQEEELPKELKGNAALAHQYGAHLEAIGHFAALLKIDEYVEELRNSGKKVYLVPNGGHTPGAVRAYQRVISYALDRLETEDIHPDAVFLPCASGTTLAGVLCGTVNRPLPRVLGIAVANTPAKAKNGVKRLIRSAAAFLPEDFQAPDFEILDSGKNDYGRPDDQLLALREEIIKKEGIILDPTYNLNAFFGMLNYLKENPGDSDVLYINTGGYTALY